MEPIQGTNLAAAVLQIAAQKMQLEDQVNFARADLVMESVEDTGAMLVDLLSSLGQNIDEYI